MTCLLCGEPTPDVLEHLRLYHPDEVVDRWPDGEPVVVDLALEPEDFDAQGD